MGKPRSIGKPRRIHIASQCYVRNWCLDDRVAVEATDDPRSPELKTTRAVGWRTGWWAANAELARKAEEILGNAEDAAAPVLRDISGNWPVSDQTRVDLAQFMAIHKVRGPAWHTEYHNINMQAIAEELQRGRWGQSAEQRAIEHAIGDVVRVDTLLRQIPRIASVLLSMQWVLVSFQSPIIASGDQPVVYMPPSPELQSTLPRSGFLDTAEVRFPIDPWHVLLLTWYPEPDLRTTVAGWFQHAADVNRSTWGQADQEWFYRPGQRPPLIAPPLIETACRPISYEIVPGYSFRTAAGSRRRQEADRLLKELIASRRADQMQYVAIKPSV